MHLLHAETLKLIDVSSHDPPPYAILSHTWGAPEDEVSYQDAKLGPEAMSTKSAYVKIKYTCRQARKDKLDYCWIDTCCIDKTSSAELQEAINSMFAWYKGARVCYVYLSDVLDNRFPHEHDIDSEFHRARWFTRGWTLQELIAPSDSIFYTRDWAKIGSKKSLRSTLAAITVIPEEILCRHVSLRSASLAQRMSWASRRQTSRPEDMAYCLMGIFSIFMPMLYGEGSQAFQRLQQEIIKTSTDSSLFAWRDSGHHESETHDLFADHPRQFIHSSEINFINGSLTDDISVTNRGLRMQARLSQLHDDKIYAMALNCRFATRSLPGIVKDSRYSGCIGIVLLRARTKYLRINIGQFLFMNHFSAAVETVFFGIDATFDHITLHLPANPEACPFTVSNIRPSQYLNNEILPLLADPMYLSDAHSRQWCIICWTVSWKQSLGSCGFVSFVHGLDSVMIQLLAPKGGSIEPWDDREFDTMHVRGRSFITEQSSNLQPFPHDPTLNKSSGAVHQGVTCCARVFSDLVLKYRFGRLEERVYPTFVIQLWKHDDRDWIIKSWF